MYKNLLIVCCLFLCFYAAPAQLNNLVFQHITRSAGLPVSDVMCLAQDSTGFIWIGSYEGLYRYDGFNFKAYLADPKSKNSIPSNLITKICVTRKGLLWVATIKGGVVLMNSNGEVLRVINSSSSKLFSEESDYTYDVKEDKQGSIWLSTEDGLFKILDDGSHVMRFDINTTQPGYNAFSQFVFDGADNIWVGTRMGIYVFNISTSAFGERCPYIPLKGDQFKTVSLYNKEIWYSSWEPDLGFYTPANKRNTILYSGKDLKNPDYFRMAECFYVDSKNTFWIGTKRGLLVKEPGKDMISASFVHDRSNPHSIIGDHIYAILEDHNNNLWFGTDEGISIARPYGQLIQNFSVNNINKYPFAGNLVNDIIEIDTGQLLVGTSQANGLYLTDQNFQIKKHFSFNDFKYDWVWKHYDDVPRNRILISTQKGMLVYDKTKCEIDIENDAFKRWYPISSFVAESDSILWFSQLRGAFVRYNLNTGNFKEYRLDAMGEKGKLSTLEKDNENYIWLLAGTSGILKFDEQSEKTTCLRPGGSQLKEGSVYFFKDLGEFFIIGYQAKGISLYYKNSGTFQHFSISDGLPSDATRDAVIAKDGTVWVATTNGIIQFDPVSRKFKSFGYEDGIINNFFHCITQLHDGRIAAGSTKGLVVFDPEKLVKSQKPPIPPILTDVAVYGKNISPDSLLSNGLPLHVSYKQNYFSIGFISLQYNNSRQLEYAYRLDRLDDSWINIGNRRFVSYANLSGGHYTFRVKVRERGGLWVESAQSLSIIIQTAFYKQWWFYFLCAVIFIAAAYSVFRYRLQQLLKMERMHSAAETEKEKMRVHHQRELLNLEAQALRAQMNPHFIFNCLNSIKALIQQRETERGITYLTTFSKLIRTLFQNSDKRQISLYDEIETCRLYTQLEAMRLNGKLKYRFDIDPNLDLKSLMVPALIVQPFIENAIWHGIIPKDGGEINITVTSDEDKIVCEVDDNGVGREMSKRNKSMVFGDHESKGFHLSQARLNLEKMLNNTKACIETIDKYENSQSTGTKVRLSFSLS